jgi:hypothetical protein
MDEQGKEEKISQCAVYSRVGKGWLGGLLVEFREFEIGSQIDWIEEMVEEVVSCHW